MPFPRPADSTTRGRRLSESERTGTVRHLAEESVRRNEAWLQTDTDSLPALVGHVGADLRYRFVNRAYEEWFHDPTTTE